MRRALLVGDIHEANPGALEDIETGRAKNFRRKREENLIPLEEAIRKMTSFPAARLGLADRGLLRPGMKADPTMPNATLTP